MKMFMISLFLSASLMAAPKAVVFDWGNVLATNDRTVVVEFMCESLHCSAEQFEEANLEKQNAMKQGKSDTDFWISFAEMEGIELGEGWAISYQEALKRSIGPNEKMFDLISELKNKGISIGLLSNIGDKYVKLIRSFGFYDPFSPCLLSCEIGLEKPDPQVYHLLLKQLDLPANEIVFIDDIIENVEAAKQLGIDAILFQSAEQIRQELEERKLL